MAPSQLRVESAANDGNGGGSGSSLSGTLASNVQTTPPKPLLNRCLENCKIIDLGAWEWGLGASFLGYNVGRGKR